MQNVQETNLAWALIEATKPHLSADEREPVFVVLGAGDTFGAIHRLFKLVVSNQIPLTPDLVRRCTAWLDTYACHEEQRFLRHLIAGFLIGRPQQVTQRVRVRRRAAKPRHAESLAI